LEAERLELVDDILASLACMASTRGSAQACARGFGVVRYERPLAPVVDPAQWDANR
jgi:hypothetical protein